MTHSHRPTGTTRTRRGGSAPRAHLHALTGLRLVAALAVYASHVPPPPGAPSWWATLQQSGYAGVTFFFVLSGFVLTLNYADGLRTRQQIWSYAVARFSRVYPLYVVVLGWTALTAWAAGPIPEKTLVLHALGLQAWQGDLTVAYAYVAPAWSISVELFLYATLPVLIPLVRLVDRQVWTILASLLLVLVSVAALAWVFQRTGRADLPWTDPASAHRWLYRTPLVRTGDFLLGVLAARLYSQVRDSPAAPRLGGWLVLVSAPVTVVVAAHPGLSLSAWSWDAAYAPLAVALVLGLALAPQHPVSHVLAARPVVFLGEASFAFYLAHTSVIHLVGAGAWTAGASLRGLVGELLDLAFAVALAIGLHLGVEKPARPLVKRWLDRRSASPAADRRTTAGTAAAEQRPAAAGPAGPATSRPAAVPPAPAVPAAPPVTSPVIPAPRSQPSGLARPAGHPTSARPLVGRPAVPTSRRPVQPRAHGTHRAAPAQVPEGLPMPL